MQHILLNIEVQVPQTPFMLQLHYESIWEEVQAANAVREARYWNEVRVNSNFPAAMVRDCMKKQVDNCCSGVIK